MTDKNLKGTKTEQNLINAFAGESQARNRYSFFAKQAKNEGYEQIAEIFLITAENEKEHAKLFYEHIGNTIGHVNSDYPFELGSTEENLKSAINGENASETRRVGTAGTPFKASAPPSPASGNPNGAVI